MTTIARICDWLESFAPRRLAEEWDNVGLLVGDAARVATRVMTCLTVTPASAAEAIAERAELIVTHHPLPFHPLKQITTATTTGRMLLDLISAGVAVYSPHTAFDSAAEGINQRLAASLGLSDIAPLIVHADDFPGVGAGRFGRYSQPHKLADVAEVLKSFLKIDRLKYVGDADRPVESVAVACGSAGSFLESARGLECDLLVTGETSFHTCLEAEACGMALLLTGHYASERFAIEYLADLIVAEFPVLSVWPSRQERDPLGWL